MPPFQRVATASLLTLLALGASPRASAAELSADVPLVDEKVRHAMQGGNYAAALQAVEQAAQADHAPKDYLAYLRGRALFLQKEYDQAVEAFAAAEAQFPESPWARRARFAGAVALARKGDFRGAELIFRKEAEYLLSENRKQEIADIYLEFADARFNPPDDRQKPDYQKALEFYQKALEVGPKPEKRIELELLVAQCHQRMDKFAEAAALYEKFIADHPEGPLNLQARFHLGDCRLAEGKLKEARRAWEDLLAKHADSQSDEIAETWYKLSRTWQAPKPEDDRRLALGVAALKAFLERFPTHRLAPQAHLEIAQSYVHRGRYEDAVASLTQFLADERYRQSKEIPNARNLLGRSYQLAKKFPEAIAAWREYLAKHPTHAEWSAVEREIINTEYLMAQEQYRAEEYDAARKLWGEFMAKYPLDQRSAQILYLFGAINYRQENWDAALADWRRLVSKYPGTEPSSRAQFMIAATLEAKLGKLDEALEEYRKVTWGSHADKARRAIARLTAKTMTVATERKFRSGETPRLKLVTRNIESVTIRAYTVNLETYFRKMHLAGGVENLDVALIDPDATFEFQIPDYAKHQELESTVKAPLPNKATSGVMVVAVASKTLEATTLVVQSDLDVIVKSSRDEVFVFAQNMRTGKPWPQARLLISNGRKVFAEGTTGDDGVFQRAYEELKEAGDTRVFAIADGHVASNLVDLEGVGASKGLSDKGYVYTDRPAYRAGQLVHVRGCIRSVLAGGRDQGTGDRDEGPEVAGDGEEAGEQARSVDPSSTASGPRPLAPDTYSIEEGKKYTVEVFDGRNRLVCEEEVALSAFGTFHFHFVLPPTSPQGQYRIVARAAGHTYQGTFQVHEYKLEPVHLAVDTPRKVFYRGEEIEGTIRASFYYGAPLAEREIRYQLADDRLHTAKTDKKGEVHFKLPTREFQESQVLSLVVTLPERNLQTGVNFFLASQGFAIGVGTIRPVYVAGESFEVTVTANDAEGKPAGRKVVLNVLKKTTVKGKVGERLVETHELETAETDGIARQTLALADGGRYVLRVEGTDRFKNPVWGELAVNISGDEDQVRLRILADRHTYKVGDTAKLRLHWRQEPALALVTFRGARVLDYRLVELQQGDNPLEIPMTATLAPNFELEVGVMTDSLSVEKRAGVTGKGEGEAGAKSPHPNPLPEGEGTGRRFHAASSPFVVERDLLVSLSTKRKGDGEGPVRPGDEVVVTVTTTDPQGNPVAAEVSLAMVEQSLLDRFAWPVPPIHDFFRGERREPAVRTTSSVSFAYRPKTRPVNLRLLAERDRLEIAAEEAASGEEARASLADFSGDIGVPPFPELADMGGEPPLADDPFAAGIEGESARRAESNAIGLAGAYRDAMGEDFSFHVGFDRGGGGEHALNRSNAPASPQAGAGGMAAGMFGYGGYAGQAPAGAMADFDSLIELTTSSVSPEAWSLENGRQVVVVNAHGTMEGLSFPTNLSLVVKQSQELIDDLKEAGAVLLPGLGPQETGYWNPSIVTDENGKATVTFAVPQRSTAWTLLAKGITAETLAGETTGELVVKKNLFGELKLPMAFTDGDQAEVIASVHNDAVEKGKIDVTLKTTIAGRSVEETKTLDVTSKGIHELVFKTVLKRPERPEGDAKGAAAEESITFELSVVVQAEGNEAAGVSDVVRRTIPLKPYGMPVFATAGGSATSDTTAWVEPPKDMPLEAPGLQILVGPTVERSLLDIVLAPAPWCQIEAGRIASGLETSTSDLMASLGLQKLLGRSQQAGGPQAQSLDGRIRSSLSFLVSSQNDDGGWSWTGRSGGSNRYSTARVVWAMSLARSAGYTVPEDGFQKAVGYLRDQLSKTDHSDYESQAILLHALSTASLGDFAVANRLYRNRPAMSTAALVHLALAFTEMDRKSTAEELLGLVAERNFDDPNSSLTSHPSSLPWSHSSAELRALYALAIQEVAPTSPEAKEQIDWLLAHRTGHRWAPDKATGPAALALSRWFARTQFEQEHYQLAVFVNDVRVKLLDVDESAGTQVIEVPASHLAPGDSPGAKVGKQRINFQITGRGRYTYQCILGGFVPADKLGSTTAEWEVRRTYEPAPLEMDGQEIPRGFDVLQGSYSSFRFRNALAELPVGRRGLVELYVHRHNVPSNTPDEQLEYLVVTEPIPSGASVIEDSVRGGFERFEISPGAITFFVGSRRRVGTIHYQLSGYLPGRYRAGPTQVRDAYRPERLAVSAPKPLGVLSSGSRSSDAYRLTPRELYELGKRHFAKGDLETAQKHLTELVEKWNLKPTVYKETVERLLDVHLELGPPAKVVRYFEIVKEKWPEKEIPFSKIVKVGAAYHEMGEYERSYLIFRATVESSFRRESGVAGFLESQGEFARSVDVMGRLLREYPPEAYLAAATYALAQRVYAKAPEAAADEKLRRAKINRVDLVRRAWTMLESFLTAYPEDPAADQAAFSTANALLELEAYPEATTACNRYAERYPESDLLDSFWYIIGYCHFALGEHAKALEMCRKVAEARRIDKATGREEESLNKWRAVYILGQVHHSLGQPADAIREYRRVADRFPDAKEAIDYFVRKAIALEEVTTVKPGEPVEVDLEFRNIASCDAKVYRIDLMKFSLLKRSLGGITRINLAGIQPLHETTLKLGDGKDYRGRTHKLPLPLGEEGAYLVVCRGENLYTGGLVLVTPLAVEVQADAASGRVRVTVKDTTTDRYLSDVHVKVIGAGNAEFISGETDLRGVFVADGVQGTPTVIAQAGPRRYAFFRSPDELTPAPYAMAAAAPQAMPEGVRMYTPVPLDVKSTSENERRIAQALTSPTAFNFIETPLVDVIAKLRNLHRIEIRLDQRALEDVGVPADTPITQQIRGVSLRSALRLMLGELDLTYVIQDEVLLITTPEEAETRLATVVYPVADLVRFRDPSGEEWSDFDSLIEMITTTVAPEAWDDVGGPGSISPMQYGNTDVIVLSQTQEVHGAVAALLERLRTLPGTKDTDGKPPVREKRPQRYGSSQRTGGFGGGGFGGGGMGGLPAPARSTGKGELLKGLQDANRELQTQQVDQLQQMYQGGFGGGVQASEAF